MARHSDEPRYHDVGPLIVERAGTALPLTAHRLTAVLSFLLIHANQAVSADALIDALWAEAPPPGADRTLSSHLFRLRRSLEAEHTRGSPFGTIVHEAGSYRLIAAPSSIDSVVFEESAEISRDLQASHHFEPALQQASRALRLWRGRPWSPHSDMAWAAPATARLDEVRRFLQQRVAECRLELGQVEQALTDLDLLIADHPLGERLRALRMRALHLLGRTDEALAAYGDARATLIEEVGIEPGVELRELHRRILTGDQTLLQTATPQITLGAWARPGPTLPRPRTALLGRSSELASLTRLLTHAQPVTIVGPAGVGKTRLIIESAHELIAEFPYGVCFVDLTSALEYDQVVESIATALGLRPTQPGTLTAAVMSYLAQRRLLLILDGGDHVIEQVARLVDQLLDEPMDAAVAVTSREPLGVQGERIWVLGPLPTADIRSLDGAGSGFTSPFTDPAMALFVERVEALGRPIQPDEAPLVSEICAALDGLPLAIELAAARTPSFSLREIATQVQSDASSLSRIGHRSGAHSSLRSLIDQSVSRLDMPTRTLHQALAAVPGPVTADAVAAIAEMHVTDVRDVLSNLVHRSLLVPLRGRGADPTRFQQLSPIRSHARQTTSAKLNDLYTQRRDAWAINLMAQMPRGGSPAEADWFQRIDNDLPLVRAFLEHNLFQQPTHEGARAATRLGFYWYYRGMVAEWERSTKRATETPAAGAAERMLAGLSHACALGLAGRGHLGMRYVPTADQVLYDDLNDEQALLLGDALFAVTTTARGTRDTALGERSAGGIRRVAEFTGDALHHLMADVASLLVELDSTDPAALLRRTESAYETALTLPNLYVAWMAASIGASLGLLLAQPDTGLRWSHRAIDHHLALGAAEAAGTLTIHGLLLSATGEHLEAAAVLAAARHQSRRSGMRWPRSDQVSTAVKDLEHHLSEQERRDAETAGQNVTLKLIASAGKLALAQDL